MISYIVALGKQLNKTEKLRNVVGTWSRGLDGPVHNIQLGDCVYVKTLTKKLWNHSGRDHSNGSSHPSQQSRSRNKHHGYITQESKRLHSLPGRSHKYVLESYSLHNPNLNQRMCEYAKSKKCHTNVHLQWHHHYLKVVGRLLWVYRYDCYWECYKLLRESIIWCNKIWAHRFNRGWQ